MTVPSVNCSHCGKNLTTDDLRRVDCRHCGTVLPHHARAAQQVAVVQQMLADRNRNGIPDAFEPLVANAQANAMNQAFGMGHPPPHAYPAYGAPPPRVQMHVQTASRAAATGIATVAIVLAVVVMMLFVAGATVAYWMLR